MFLQKLSKICDLFSFLTIFSVDDKTASDMKQNII